MPYNPKYTLKTASLNPVGFQAAVYTPQKEDMSLLQRSFAIMDERREKLNQERANVAKAFSEARALLPDNEETNKYITDAQNDALRKIDSASMFGMPDLAIEAGKTAAADFISSPEFNARTKYHKQRSIWLEQLKNTNVDNFIKEYYQDTYSDVPEFTRDDKGNITGAKEFIAPLPEQGQSASAIIQAAVKATADERIDGTTSWTGETGTGGHNQFKREYLSADKISKTAISFINSDPRVKQYFIDQFNAGIHQINKLESRINALNDELNITTDTIKRKELENKIATLNNQMSGYKSVYYKNSAPLENAETYIENLFSPDNKEIKNAEYDYKHSNTGSSAYAKGNNGGSNLGLLPGAPSLEGGTDLDSPGQPTKQRTVEGTSMPTRGTRPSTTNNKNNNKTPGTYVAPGNYWTPKRV